MNAKSQATVSNQPAMRTERASGIATLTMARPDQRNSLNRALLDELTRAIEAHGRDQATRVIVIGADGPVFSAGHDMKELTRARQDPDQGKAFFEQTMAKSGTLMKAIIACPKPVIAKVQGTATAAGCQIVASCDLAVAADHASFITPGVDIGLFCSTPMVALSRNVPRKQAMEMLLLGDSVTAKRARELGLINWVVEASGLEAKTLEVALAIAAKSMKAIALGKQAFYAQIDTRLSEAYDLAQQTMVENLLTQDAEEGLEAFIEKRAPHWSDN